MVWAVRKGSKGCQTGSDHHGKSFVLKLSGYIGNGLDIQVWTRLLSRGVERQHFGVGLEHRLTMHGMHTTSNSTWRSKIMTLCLRACPNFGVQQDFARRKTRRARCA